MKILCYSDIHGILPDTTDWPRADLFICAGDICPNWSYNWSQDGPMQINWLQDVFNPWLAKVPATCKILIGGNHDGFNLVPNFLEILGWAPAVWEASLHPIYLENSGCEVMGKKIWGSPNTIVPKWYRNNRWNYGIYNDDEDESKAALIWDQIPNDTNILITHSPAYGYFDQCDERAGSKSLLSRIEYLKTFRKLDVHVTGHIHEQTGILLERTLNRTLRKMTNPFYRINSAQTLQVVEI
jgi:predicted phosphodiesterase